MQEIKIAYRKMAMTFHPDRNMGDTSKADTFKSATDAYSILGDHAKRTEYDKVSHGFYGSTTMPKREYATPSNYRKVYSPRPPPGFKTFDNQRHFDMHYGDGQMRAEIERVQKRALKAGEKSEYQSPLGPGFSFGHFEKTGEGNLYSKSTQGAKPITGGGTIHYEEQAFFGGEFAGRKGGESNAIRHFHKTYVRGKMEERRQSRPTEEERKKLRGSGKSSSCTIS
jgi:curved DNA-binding protein CbpA